MPTGNRLRDGHATWIGFANAPNIALWELEVQPPGVDGGGPNDTTTMRSVTYHQAQPKKLKKMTSSTFKVQYDEAVLTDIIAQVNVNQLLTITFPTGRPWAAYGWLDKWIPDPLKFGEPPTASVTVEWSMTNLSGAETAPTVGTTTTTTTTTPAP